MYTGKRFWKNVILGWSLDIVYAMAQLIEYIAFTSCLDNDVKVGTCLTMKSKASFVSQFHEPGWHSLSLRQHFARQREFLRNIPYLCKGLAQIHHISRERNVHISGQTPQSDCSQYPRLVYFLLQDAPTVPLTCP